MSLLLHPSKITKLVFSIHWLMGFWYLYYVAFLVSSSVGLGPYPLIGMNFVLQGFGVKCARLFDIPVIKQHLSVVYDYVASPVGLMKLVFNCFRAIPDRPKVTMSVPDVPADPCVIAEPFSDIC